MPLKTRGREEDVAVSAILLIDSGMMPGECRRPPGKSEKTAHSIVAVYCSDNWKPARFVV